MQIKFTKTELRFQQNRLIQLQKYLPTIKLKKALLQLEVQLVEGELEKAQEEFKEQENKILPFAKLLTDSEAYPLFDEIEIEKIEKTVENIAGIDVPIFNRAVFAAKIYGLFDTPVWMEDAIAHIEVLLSIREKIKSLRDKKLLLSKELREVSIRVNLFEKSLIPRTEGNINKIRIFLGDQMLAAVAQAKVSKSKIESRKLKVL